MKKDILKKPTGFPDELWNIAISKCFVFDHTKRLSFEEILALLEQQTNLYSTSLSPEKKSNEKPDENVYA